MIQPVLVEHFEAVIDLLRKYDDVPISVADACVVRMTELLPRSLALTTDAHFSIYRRHGRKVVPVLLP
jgi:predicted nucleic acid-binding protein